MNRGRALKNRITVSLLLAGVARAQEIEPVNVSGRSH